MKDSPQAPRDLPQVLDRFAAERRRFLAEGTVYGAGAGILVGLGLSQYARAQGAPPAGGSGPGARPPPPPEPAFSQRAPLHDLKGKVRTLFIAALQRHHGRQIPARTVASYGDPAGVNSQERGVPISPDLRLDQSEETHCEAAPQQCEGQTLRYSGEMKKFLIGRTTCAQNFG